jgi:hypothetical protein
MGLSSKAIPFFSPPVLKRLRLNRTPRLNPGCPLLTHFNPPKHIIAYEITLAPYMPLRCGLSPVRVKSMPVVSARDAKPDGHRI